MGGALQTSSSSETIFGEITTIVSKLFKLVLEISGRIFKKVLCYVLRGIPEEFWVYGSISSRIYEKNGWIWCFWRFLEAVHKVIYKSQTI